MSRTKRHIPYWANYRTLFVGCGGFAYEQYPQWQVNQHRWYNGYDKHHAASYVRIAEKGWGEALTGPTRAFYKRKEHRARRRKDKKEILSQLED